MSSIPTFQAGETIRLSLEDTAGTDALPAANTVTAIARKTRRAMAPPPLSEPIAATFTATARAAASYVGPGYDLVALSGIATPGIYWVGLKFLAGAETIKADELYIRIEPSPV